MRIIKGIITLCFLISSYWVTFLIFKRQFSNPEMKFSPDSWSENTLMLLLLSIGISMIGVFLMGLLSIFTHFVFVRLMYTDEIREAAFHIIRRNRTAIKKSEHPIDIYWENLQKENKQKWYKKIKR